MFVRCDECANRKEDGYCAVVLHEPFSSKEYLIPCPTNSVNCGNYVKKED